MSRPSSFDPGRPGDPRLAHAAFFAASLMVLPDLASAGLDMPVGGWREGNPEAPYTQSVSYPASRPGLDADVPDAAQIRGRIAQHGKGPATLVVNGAAMPLDMDEEGRFARAYSFANGANSVEIRGPDGEPRYRTQFYQRAAGQPAARLRIILSWDTSGTDLDLHVVTPTGDHAWYGERVIPGGAIDVDVTTGYGPEIFASPAPAKGVYQVWVNYFGGGEEHVVTTARLAVISNEGSPSERRQEFDVPMRKAGELTLVRQFMYP